MNQYSIVEKCCICNNDFLKKSGSHSICGSRSCLEERNKRNKKTLKSGSWMEILKRDNFRCFYCGKSSIEDGIKLVIDHVIPISENGVATINNVATCCHFCNSGKSYKRLDPNDEERVMLEISKRNKKFNDELAYKINKSLKTKIHGRPIHGDYKQHA